MGTAITLAISSPFDVDESATCTYTCNSDGSCEHRTDLTSGYHYSMKSGTCVSPKYSCLNGICCKGQTYQCRDKVGKLVIEDGQVKSNGLRTNENKPATHSNNLQTTRHNSPSPFSNPRGECVHQCSQTESCSTEATWYVGRSRKWARGSCFSPDFKGGCSGIPDPCDSCRSACGYRNGRHTTPLKFGAQRTFG